MMPHAVIRSIRRLLRRVGYDVPSYTSVPTDMSEIYPPDFDEATIGLCRYVRPFTMTSPERICALRESVHYIVQHDIPGDFVECGVWRGGSMMAVAKSLMEKGVTHRGLHLFDTFEGMPEPSELDRRYSGEAAADLLSQARSDGNTRSVWAYCSLDEVKRNMFTTGYDDTKIRFVAGKVERTLPQEAPDHISLLRLDTDWYESTYHELTHLFPRLSVGGVLIVDDYGYWEGQRRAVDEYIRENNLAILLHRIDTTARICVKLKA